jgi:WD40 repeat protein
MFPAGAHYFAFSPDGRILAFARLRDSDYHVLLWDTRLRKTTASIPLESWIDSLAFNPSGTVLAVGTHDGVKLWRLSDRRLVATITLHQSAEQLEFTPDGKQLAIADDHGVQIWNVNPVSKSGVPFFGDQRGSGSSMSFAFSPNGRTLAIADGSRLAVMWDLRPTFWRRELCRIIDRDLTRSERTQYLPKAQRSEQSCPEGAIRPGI